MQRHINYRHSSVSSPQLQTMQTFIQMSAVSISTSFHLHHLWDDRIREDILGSVSITTIFTSHSTSIRQDCLVLFTMAACLSGNAEHHTSNRIFQRHSPSFWSDFYFVLSKRNLIVLDDQIIDPSKDKRIINLFYCRLQTNVLPINE